VADCTVGGGGHADRLLEATSPDGRLLGIDADRAAISEATHVLERFGDRVVLRHANFESIYDVALESGLAPLDAVLFDLGLSSYQLADPQAIVAAREEGRIVTAADLADVVARAAPPRPGGADAGRIHPATRTFQALRVAVNREVEVLSTGLAGALAALRPGGRMAVISYHSIEDRIVKRFIARESRDCIEDPLPPVCTCGHRAQLRAITKGVVTPGPEEVRRNRRARSARLRVAEKLA
jgi:16S rRNA (cytosine1402-N4)-methyltransferase